jgi:hypothetical protein
LYAALMPAARLMVLVGSVQNLSHI